MASCCPLVASLRCHGLILPEIKVGAGIRVPVSCTMRLPVFARFSTAKGLAMASVQAFAKPERVSPSSRNDALQNLAASEAVFLIQLNTSKHERSGLSDPEAGVMISLIGENGNALLQRVPAHDECTLVTEGSSKEILFQTGSEDLITLHGSKLGRLGAVWVAPESGTWRVERVIVAEIPCTEQNLNTIGKMEGRDGVHDLLHGLGREPLTGLLHLFQENEVLVGDKCCSPAMEFNPCAIYDFHDGTGLKAHWIQDAQRVDGEVRKAGMQEYRALKTSLLGVSGLLVALGTSLLIRLDLQQGAESFAVGGLGGFVYLLLLQYAVDGIPGPDSSVSIVDDDEHKARDDSTEARSSPLFKLPANTLNLALSPLVRIPLVASFTIALARTILGSSVSPHELLVGVAGFFISVKLSIFIAAAMDIGSAANKRSRNR